MDQSPWRGLFLAIGAPGEWIRAPGGGFRQFSEDPQEWEPIRAPGGGGNLTAGKMGVFYLMRLSETLPPGFALIVAG